LDCWENDEIDASSNNITVKLLLGCPVSVLKKTYPIKENLDAIKLAALDDLILELANRYMDSLKNKLIPYDHTLNIGIPVKQYDVDGFYPMTRTRSYCALILAMKLWNVVYIRKLLIRTFPLSIMKLPMFLISMVVT
jgi:hypothetical protein